VEDPERFDRTCDISLLLPHKKALTSGRLR
jgi:hypothetical protein